MRLFLDKKMLSLTKEFIMNEELLRKAKSARNADEIRELALQAGLDISPDGAKDIFSRLTKSGSLDDPSLEV